MADAPKDNPKLVGPASLPGHVGIDSVQGQVESRAAIGYYQAQSFTLRPSGIAVSQKGFLPGFVLGGFTGLAGALGSGWRGLARAQPPTGPGCKHGWAGQ